MKTTSFYHELTARGRSPRTIEAYLDAVDRLSAFYRQEPEQLNDEQLSGYLHHLMRDRGVSPNSVNVVVSGLRNFYSLTLGRPNDSLERALPRLQQPASAPRVFDLDELERLFTVGCPNTHHRVFLMIVYTGGLRLGEACRLRPAHLDRQRMRIRVELGKNGESRETLLSPRVLEELCDYWRTHRPAEWLFPSNRDPSRPIGDYTGQRIYWSAIERAGLRRNGGIQSLRDSFAVHLLEGNVDVQVVQRLMGHGRRATTARYLKLCPSHGPRQAATLPSIDLHELAHRE